MVIEQAPHILPTLDEEMAAFIEKELSHQGVEVITSHAVAGFEDHGNDCDWMMGVPSLLI